MTVHIDPDRARQAVKTGHMRYVLAISLLGAAIAMSLVGLLSG